MRDLVVALSGWTALVAGCGGAPSPPARPGPWEELERRHQEAAAKGEETTGGPAIPTGIPSATSPSIPTPTSTATAIPTPTAATSSPRRAPFDIAAWLAERGVRDVSAAFVGEVDDIALDDCQAIGRIARREAVHCPRVETNETMVVLRDEVWILDRQRLRRVLSVPLSVGALDVAATADAKAVKLSLAFDDTGTRVDVSDEQSACDTAYAEQRRMAQAPRLEESAASRKRELDIVCDARGRYVYAKGAFHHTVHAAAARLGN